MAQAVVFGVIGSVALVLGGGLGAFWKAPMKVSGVLLAFASGTLISALAFELFPEAVELGGLTRAAGGLLAGGFTFVVVNTWLDAKVAAGAGDPEEAPGLPDELAGAEAEQTERVGQAAARPAGSAVGLALLAAVTLDGVPENIALGVSLLGDEATGATGATGGTLALLVAIFASNFPESLVGAVAMRRNGRSATFAVAVWSGAAVLLTGAVVLGYGALSGLSESALAFPLAFAGGAVLASLADTLMPEAFEHGRPLNSFATAVGFFVSFVLAQSGAG